jgi:hypothetical protein
MSNNGFSPLPLFNNNKSLYGSRPQANQLSKKISIIEDKTTLEPFRLGPSSPIISSTNYQRSLSVNIPVSSSSQLHKQIQIQKQALNTFELGQMHGNVNQQLDEWKNSMYNRVQTMKNRILEENTQSYEQLISFQNLMKKLLEEKLIKQLLLMKNDPQSINIEELDEIEQRLEQMKVKIKRLFIKKDYFFIAFFRMRLN